MLVGTVDKQKPETYYFNNNNFWTICIVRHGTVYKTNNREAKAK